MSTDKMKKLYLAAYEEGKGKNWHIPVLILNQNTEPVEFSMYTSAGTSTDTGYMDLGTSRTKEFRLEPNESIEIDRFMDGGELDFLTEYWITCEGKRFEAGINGSMFYWSMWSKKDIPVIGKKGFLRAFA